MSGWSFTKFEWWFEWICLSVICLSDWWVSDRCWGMGVLLMDVWEMDVECRIFKQWMLRDGCLSDGCWRIDIWAMDAEGNIV